jgi:hypothetical protein
MPNLAKSGLNDILVKSSLSLGDTVGSLFHVMLFLKVCLNLSLRSLHRSNEE